MGKKSDTSATSTDTSPPLRITSSVEGFWRGGVQHTRKAQPYPAGTFTPDQLEALESEPMLTVERLTDAEYAAAVEKVAAKAAQV